MPEPLASAVQVRVVLLIAFALYGCAAIAFAPVVVMVNEALAGIFLLLEEPGRKLL